MAGVSVLRRYDKGVVLLKQNDSPTCLYILIKGTLRVTITPDQATEIEIEYRKTSHELETLKSKYSYHHSGIIKIGTTEYELEYIYIYNIHYYL